MKTKQRFKRISTVVSEPTLKTATTDELFTELIIRIRLSNNDAVYFIDSTTEYPKWSIYSVSKKPIAVEIKNY